MAGFIQTVVGVSYDKNSVLKCMDEYNNYITALTEIIDGGGDISSLPPVPTRSALRKNSRGGFSIPETDAFIDRLEAKAKALRADAGIG